MTDVVASIALPIASILRSGCPGGSTDASLLHMVLIMPLVGLAALAWRSGHPRADLGIPDREPPRQPVSQAHSSPTSATALRAAPKPAATIPGLREQGAHLGDLHSLRDREPQCLWRHRTGSGDLHEIRPELEGRRRAGLPSERARLHGLFPDGRQRGSCARRLSRHRSARRRRLVETLPDADDALANASWVTQWFNPWDHYRPRPGSIRGHPQAGLCAAQGAHRPLSRHRPLARWRARRARSARISLHRRRSSSTRPASPTGSASPNRTWTARSSISARTAIVLTNTLCLPAAALRLE